MNGMSLLFAIAMAPVVILTFPLLCWVGAGVGLYKLNTGVRAKRVAFVVKCSIDADCPLGYVCVEGRCLPEPYSSHSS